MDRVLKSQDIWANPVMRVEEYELLSDATQKSYSRGVVNVQDAVAVLALDQDNNYVFVRQPRFAVREPALLELIAGKVDDYEAPSYAAHRETEEETGMLVTELQPLGAYYSSPAYLSETIHLFLARVIPGGERGGDDVLSVAPVTVAPKKLLHWIQGGEIKDGKILAAVGACQIIYGVQD